MKVLFVFIDTRTSAGYATGLGISLISGHLKRHGNSTSLVYFRSAKDLGYLLEKVERENPRIVGYYSTSVNRGSVDAVSRSVRERFPRILQIYGGVHATLHPESLEVMNGLDALCAGHGEPVMRTLVRRLDSGQDITDIPGLWVRTGKAGRSGIVRNPPISPAPGDIDAPVFDNRLFLDELSRFPDFDRKSFPLELIFNRSCPFDCTFCCNSELRKVYRARLPVPPPEASIRALKAAVTETGLCRVVLHDDILTVNKAWFRDFIGRYAEEVCLPFVCNLRAGTFDADDLRRLKMAGLTSAWLGVESGNDEIRNNVMNKKLSRQAILDATELMHRHGIGINVQNIIGAPCETPARFLDTVRLNAKCWPVREYQLSFFYPYPGTGLHARAVKEGLLDESFDKFDREERIHPSLRLPGFSKEEQVFYFTHFRELIWYQHNRDLWPWLLVIPLNEQTSKLVVHLLRYSTAAARLGKSVVRRVVPGRVRQRTRALASAFRDALRSPHTPRR
jgi:anaerobic magnesium-protoporphyrin IX monomethyl ester cyclase